MIGSRWSAEYKYRLGLPPPSTFSRTYPPFVESMEMVVLESNFTSQLKQGNATVRSELILDFVEGKEVKVARPYARSIHPDPMRASGQVSSQSAVLPDGIEQVIRQVVAAGG